jgi:hypothetical protein
MATTYTHSDFESGLGPFPDLGSAVLHRFVDETTIGAADEDVYKLAKLRRGLRIVDALLQREEGDSHATPTGVGELEITDGTTTKKLIDGFDMGAADSIVRPTKGPATENAIGFIVPDNTWWLQLRVSTVCATSTAHDYIVLVHVSPHRMPGELTE